MLTICECEHVSHFPQGEPEDNDSAHIYQAPRGVDTVEPVATDYGSFNLCAGCRDAGHMTTKAVQP